MYSVTHLRIVIFETIVIQSRLNETNVVKLVAEFRNVFILRKILDKNLNFDNFIIILIKVLLLWCICPLCLIFILKLNIYMLIIMYWLVIPDNN